MMSNAPGLFSETQDGVTGKSRHLCYQAVRNAGGYYDGYDETPMPNCGDRGNASDF